MGINKDQAATTCKAILTGDELVDMLYFIEHELDEGQLCSPHLSDGDHHVIVGYLRRAKRAAAAAQPGATPPGGAPPQFELMTAMKVMSTRVPPVSQRRSLRRCSAETQGAKRHTLDGIRQWPDFDRDLESLRESLDDTQQLYRGITLPGSMHRTCLNPAANEGEVRGPMSWVCLIPNDVAATMMFNSELIGGGSSRSASCADWVVRKRTVEPGQEMGSAPIRNARLDPQAHSDRTLGCVEIKGPWQWDLEEGEDPATLPPERWAALEPAFQQLFGDMVMDEAPVGMISRHDVCVLVQRPQDVRDKTLIVSPAIGLGRVLLACLLLLKLAHERQGWKANLPRDLVPSTPADRLTVGQPDSPPHQDDHGQQPAHGSAHGGQGGDQPPSKRHRTRAPADQGGPDVAVGPLPEPAGTDTEHVETEVGGSGSDGSGGTHINLVVVEYAPASPTCHSRTRLQLCNFASVGLTGVIISGTRYGKVLQGMVGGVPAVVKLFDPRFKGAAESMHHEWRVYEHLGSRGAHGVCVPCLLKVGEFVHTGASFLALSDEGVSLPSKDALGATDREAARVAVRSLHAAGVLHGDIRRANFVRGESGVVKLVDFESATILPLEGGDQSKVEAQKAAELVTVDAL